MALAIEERKKIADLAENITAYMSLKNMQCLWIEGNPEELFPTKELRNKFSELLRNNYEAVVDFWNDSMFIALPRAHYTPTRKISDIEKYWG